MERHSGTLKLPGGERCEVFDIPGTYSLSARSAEEQIACQAILGLPPYEAPEVVVVVIDATQLLRNLYLTLQILESGARVVVALNMVDLVASGGARIDHERLAQELGVPVVPVSGLRGSGIDDLARAIERCPRRRGPAHRSPCAASRPTSRRADITPRSVTDSRAPGRHGRFTRPGARALVPALHRPGRRAARDPRRAA